MGKSTVEFRIKKCKHHCDANYHFDTTFVELAVQGPFIKSLFSQVF